MLENKEDCKGKGSVSTLAFLISDGTLSHFPQGCKGDARRSRARFISLLSSRNYIATNNAAWTSPTWENLLSSDTNCYLFATKNRKRHGLIGVNFISSLFAVEHQCNMGCSDPQRNNRAFSATAMCCWRNSAIPEEFGPPFCIYITIICYAWTGFRKCSNTWQEQCLWAWGQCCLLVNLLCRNNCFVLFLTNRITH